MCGLASGFWSLLLARIGVGGGGTNPASHSLIADLYPSAQRATAAAVYSVGPHPGIVLAFGLGGFVAQALGWRAAFVARLPHAGASPHACAGGRRARLGFGVFGAAGTYAAGRIADAAAKSDARRKGRATGACQLLIAVLWLPALLIGDRTAMMVAAVVPCALAGAYLGPTIAMIQDAAQVLSRRRKRAIFDLGQRAPVES